MHEVYGQYLGSVLLVFGGGLQWFRASGVRDAWCVVIGTVGALVGWALCVDWAKAAVDPRLFALQQILVFPGCLSAVFGGTFMVSKGASAAVKKFALDPAHPMVPVTNNQKEV